MILGLEYLGPSVDLFAAGVILFIMLTGQPPFKEASPTIDPYKMICTNRYEDFWAYQARYNKISLSDDLK